MGRWSVSTYLWPVSLVSQCQQLQMTIMTGMTVMKIFSLSHLKWPVCQSLPIALVYVPEKISSSQVPHLGFIFSA